MGQLLSLSVGRRLVLVVDDEPATVEVLRTYLEDDGFQVVCATDGLRALSLALEMQPDIVLLDIDLPKLSGLEVLRAIRAGSDVPVIMLTSRGHAVDRVTGLEVGADDYIGKPFSVREVVARVKAILRRRQWKVRVPLAKRDVLCFGPIEIDRSAVEVRRHGIPIDVTPTEFRVLNMLADHADCALTRDQIISHVSPDSDVYDRTLDRHIANLRQKIEDVPARPTLIVTVVGFGYKLADPHRVRSTR
jgi:two-component system alkaline phosphatase synthesis response regulator PhoP